jgi:hypothetical protein
MSQILASLAATVQTPPQWVAPYLPLLQRLLCGNQCDSVATALNAVRNLATDNLCFAEHSALPAGESYEAFIARTACIPTRDNLHDLFNGVIWLTYPHTKRRLNALQAQQIAAHGVTGSRGAVRDATTLFDENAALLRAPDALVDALRRRDWNTLFIQQRSLWRSARLTIFGHALLEKLMQPRKAITAHVWVVPEMTDTAIASSLNREQLVAKPFMPLPILGVPGWWTPNADPQFYADQSVFRVPR